MQGGPRQARGDARGELLRGSSWGTNPTLYAPLWDPESTRARRGVLRGLGGFRLPPPIEGSGGQGQNNPTHIATPYKPNPQKICYIIQAARGVLNSLNMDGGFCMTINGVDVVEHLRARRKFYHVGDPVRKDLDWVCDVVEGLRSQLEEGALSSEPVGTHTAASVGAWLDAEGVKLLPWQRKRLGLAPPRRNPEKL